MIQIQGIWLALCVLLVVVVLVSWETAYAHPNLGGSNVDENANHMGHLIPDGFDGQNPRYFALMHRTDTYSWETRDIAGVHDNNADTSGSFDWPPETGDHYIIMPDSRLVGGDGRIAVKDSIRLEELVLHKGIQYEADQSNFESYVINRDASDDEVVFTVVFKKEGTFRAALTCKPPVPIGGNSDEVEIRSSGPGDTKHVIIPIPTAYDAATCEADDGLDRLLVMMRETSASDYEAAGTAISRLGVMQEPARTGTPIVDVRAATIEPEDDRDGSVLIRFAGEANKHIRAQIRTFNVGESIISETVRGRGGDLYVFDESLRNIPGIVFRINDDDLRAPLKPDTIYQYLISTNTDTKFDDPTSIVGYLVTKPTENPVTIQMPEQQSVDEDNRLQYQIPFNNPDGHRISWSIVGDPRGNERVDRDGRFTWDIGEADGGDTYKFNIQAEATGNTIRRALFVQVNDTNLQPVWNIKTNHSAFIQEPFTLLLDATDADIPEQHLTYTFLSNTVGAEISGNTLSWLPKLEHNGSQTLMIRVSDNYPMHLSADITLYFEVRAPIYPSAPFETHNTTEDTEIIIMPRISDEDGTVRITYASNGTFGRTVFDNTSITYTPDRDRNGEDMVNYTVTDNDGLTADGVLTIGVEPVRDVPEFVDLIIEYIPEGKHLTFLVTVESSGLDVFNYTLEPVTGGHNADKARMHNNRFDWTPRVGGITSSGLWFEFDFTVADGQESETEKMPIIVTAVSGSGIVSPTTSITNDIYVEFPEDASHNITLAQLVDNDIYGFSSDPVRDGVTAMFDQQNNVTVTEVTNDNQTYTIEPDGDFAGVTTARYIVNGGEDGARHAFVIINVTGVSDPPVLDEIGAITISEEAPWGIDIAATDPDREDELTFNVLDMPDGMTFSNNRLEWEPTEAQGPGEYMINVTVTDGMHTDYEVVTITVQEVNLPPVFDEDIQLNHAVRINSTFTLQLDVTDPDIPRQNVMLSIRHAAGDLADYSISPTGLLSWTPEMAVENTIIIDADDGSGDSPATLIIAVTATLIAATTDTATTNGRDPLVIPVLDNDEPADARIESVGQNLTLADGRYLGDVTHNMTHITYAPNEAAKLVRDGTSGSVQYTIDSPTEDGTSSADITITFDSGRRVDAVDDRRETRQNIGILIPVLENDVYGLDPQSNITVNDAGVSGRARLDEASGGVRYVPPLGFSGQTRFMYTLTDDISGARDTATVFINVTRNEPPEALNFTISVPAGESLTVDLEDEGHISDENDVPTSLRLSFEQPSQGSVTGLGRTITYTAYSNATDSDSFTYAITDPSDESDNATVTVLITKRPVAPNVTRIIEEDSKRLHIDLVHEGVRNLGGGAVNIAGSLVVTGLEGVVSSEDLNIYYIPAPNWHGVGTIEYTVQDDEMNTAKGYITINVTSIDDLFEFDDTQTTHIINSGATFNIDLNARDADDPTDTSIRYYILSQNPAEPAATINAETGLLSWAQTTDESVIIKVMANNSAGDTDDIVLGVAVDDSDDADFDVTVTVPRNAQGGNVMAETTSRWNLGTNTSESVQYSLDPSVPRAKVYPTGHLVYVPLPNQTGKQILAVRADNGNHSVVEHIELTVNEPFVHVNSLVREGNRHRINIDTLTNERVNIGFLVLPSGGRTSSISGFITYDGNQAGLSHASSTINNIDPNAIYYAQLRLIDREPRSSRDTLVYAQFTPRVNGFEIIANPHTAPGSPPEANDTSTSVVSAAGNTATVTPEIGDPDGDAVHITSVTDIDPALGTATHTDTTVTYAPVEGVSGTDTIRYTVTDSTDRTFSASITVDITLQPMPPVALNVTANATEDMEVTIMPEISDPDGGNATITGVTNGTNGTADHTATTVTYKPDPDFNGNDTVTYTVTDDEGQTTTGAINIIVTSVSDPPVLHMIDNMEIYEHELFEFNLTATDPDRDDDASSLTYRHVNAPAGLNITGNRLSWTPNEEQGDDDYTFNITVSDDEGYTDSQEVTFEVTETNQDPRITAVMTSVRIVGQPTSITIAAVDADIPAQTLSWNITGNDLGATISGYEGVISPPNSTHPFPVIGHYSTIDWTPNVTHAGNQTLSILVQDDFDPPGSDSIDLQVTVPQNYDLLGYNFTATVARNDAAIIPVITGPDDSRTITSASNPSLSDFFDSYRPLGDLLDEYLPFGIIVYNAGYQTGNDIITYTVDDGRGGTYNGTMRITVIEPNTNPVLRYIGDRSINAQDTLEFQARADDDEDDDDMLTFGLEDEPAGAMMAPEGHFSWRPADFDVGRHIFTVTVTDPAGAADSEEIAVLVRPAGMSNLHQPPLRYPVFKHPVAPDIQAATRQGQPVAIIPPIDPSPTITQVSSPAKGSIRSETLRLGFIVYTPASGQSGTDRIIYTVSGANSGIITVYINEPGNTRPVLGTINSASVKVGGHLAFDASATDDDGHALTFGIANAPAGATINPTTGRFSWEPTISQAGNHTVTITVHDGHGGADWQDVNMTVTFTPPQARNIELRTDAGRTVSMDIADILHDPDDDNATASIYIRPSMGHAEASNTTITYTANHDADGTDFFSYMVTNNHGASGIWFATVKVGPHAADPTINRDPVAPDLRVRTVQDESFVTITPAPTDPDGDELNITSAIGTPRGTVTNSTLFTGSITYRPQPGYYGIDTITYAVSDGKGGTDTGIITVYVRERSGSNPWLNHIGSKAVNADNRLSFVVTGHGSHPLNFDIGDAPAGAAISGHGVFSWTPTNSQLGYHQLTIIAHDGRGGAVWQDVGIRVHPAGTINSNPTAPDTTVLVAPGGLASIQPSVSDPDGNTVEIRSATGARRGTINTEQLSGGIILYAPQQTSGTDTIIYTVSDGNGGTSVGTITVIIGNSPVLDPIAGMRISAHDTLRFRTGATDPNGDALNYTLSGQPRGADITDSGEFSWTPDGNQTGTHTFAVIVSDGSNSDSKNVTITVLPERAAIPAPDGRSTVTAQVSNATIAGILEAYMSRGLVVFADDPASGHAVGPHAARGNTLAGFLFAGIMINGTDAGLPGAGIADYDISDDTTVFISELGNVPPVLSQIGVYSVNAHQALTFGVHAVDFGGAAVSYRLSGAPAGAEISEQGIFSWTPGSRDTGSHTFTVIAYDWQGAADTESVTVTVLAAETANRAPDAPDVTATVSPNGRITIIPAVSDPDGDPVRITDATGDAGGSVTFGSGHIRYAAGPNPGIEMVSYTVQDSRGAASTGTITITMK